MTFAPGRRINPETGATVEVPEAEHWYRCAACGRMVDKRDLAAVMAHLDVVNHPGAGRGR
jgi:hypothetical protein